VVYQWGTKTNCRRNPLHGRTDGGTGFPATDTGNGFLVGTDPKELPVRSLVGGDATAEYATQNTRTNGYTQQRNTSTPTRI
jgi:hypothetical protein